MSEALQLQGLQDQKTTTVGEYEKKTVFKTIDTLIQSKTKSMGSFKIGLQTCLPLFCSLFQSI